MNMLNLLYDIFVYVQNMEEELGKAKNTVRAAETNSLVHTDMGSGLKL